MQHNLLQKKTIQFEGQAPVRQFNVLRVNGDCPVEGSLLLSLLGSIIYSTGVAKLVWGRPLGSHYTASHGMAIFAYHAGCSWRGQSAARPFCLTSQWCCQGMAIFAYHAGFTCVCLTKLGSHVFVSPRSGAGHLGFYPGANKSC